MRPKLALCLAISSRSREITTSSAVVTQKLIRGGVNDGVVGFCDRFDLLQRICPSAVSDFSAAGLPVQFVQHAATPNFHFL